MVLVREVGIELVAGQMALLEILLVQGSTIFGDMKARK